MTRRPAIAVALLALALFALNIWLNLPLFQGGAQPYRGSIESGYAGISRFLAQHPNPWGWNANAYGGISTHHLYLPGLPYTVALWMRLHPDLSALEAYRQVTATFACFGPVSLFLFALYATRSRAWALAAAIAYTFCSPSYDLFQTVDKDRGLLPIPWRLHVMVKYGEGPHNGGLALLPLALIGVWEAAKDRGFRRVFAAALGLAAVALTHWIAALALAVCCTVLLAVYLIRRAETFRHARVAMAGLLAYGLACFWLTPTFIRAVALNWPQDAFGYTLANRQRLALLLIAAVSALLWWLFRKEFQHRYLCFVTICFFIFAALTEGHYAHGVDAIPESRRYALEMELFLALAAAEWLRVGWKAGGEVNRFCVIAASLLLLSSAFPQARRFAGEGYSAWKLRPEKETAEYRVANWLNERTLSGRAYVSGGLRFRLHSWFDLNQTNGTFDSGVLSRTPLDFDYRIRSGAGLDPGHEAEQTRWILQAMGVEYAVVHGQESEEYYRDVKRPERIESSLEKVYEHGGDRVYRVPYRGLGFILYEDDLPRSGATRHLETFVKALENPGRAVAGLRWEGQNRLWIEGGEVPPDHAVTLLMNYDPGWRATQDGQRLVVDKDNLGYIRLRTIQGRPATVLMEYGPTGERIAALILTVLCWVWALGKLLRERRVRSGNLHPMSGVQ
ncbi:MAG: hypothetical protein HYZ37_08970 [Candidatus Solibacter usitatus]|nr:hypothetical protein [Candidatus Solibacter usitatus]